MRRYKIQVITLRSKFLVYTVSSYEIDKGNFVKFVDERTGKNKCFHASNCEIEEVGVNDCGN